MKPQNVVFACPRFSIVKEELLSENGKNKNQTHYVVSKQDSVSIAATIEERILLIRAHRPIIDKVAYELPGGRIDNGEKPLQAARREFFEETRVHLRNARYLTAIHPNPHTSREKMHIYRARLGGESTKINYAEIGTDESQGAFLFTPSEVKNLIYNQKFHFAVDVVTLIWAFKLL